jgi:hypothetical protein
MLLGKLVLFLHVTCMAMQQRASAGPKADALADTPMA